MQEGWCICVCFTIYLCLHLNGMNWDNIVQFNAHTISDNLRLFGSMIQLEPLSWRILFTCLLQLSCLVNNLLPCVWLFLYAEELLQMAQIQRLNLVSLSLCRLTLWLVPRAHKNGRLVYNSKLVVRSKLFNHTKNRTSGHVLSNNGLCLCSWGVAIFSSDSKFQLVWSCTLLLCSYALLLVHGLIEPLTSFTLLLWTIFCQLAEFSL